MPSLNSNSASISPGKQPPDGRRSCIITYNAVAAAGVSNNSTVVVVMARDKNMAVRRLMV
jgi:hypothetical protein